MPRTVALVACVGKKQPTPRPARELYCSDWFRKASAYADRVSDDWYILSAEHGLVAPATVIAPYDKTLKRMPTGARRAWAKQILHNLGQVLQPGDRVVILAGRDYRAHLMASLREMGCLVEIPMEGLAIGQQLAWLKRQLESSDG